jgi:nucleoside-diphosphate-sugar epimerase
VSVPACESDPAAATRINVTLAESTVATVLDWAHRRRASAKVIYVSTGHVYAAPQAGARLSEEAATLPRSVYAQTKLAAEQVLTALTAAHEVAFLIARTFGLVAPRQAPNYVLPGLIERARSGRLDGVPGLDFARDYLDARDVCDDLLRLTRVPWPDRPQIVNVCSGVPVTIRELLLAVLHETNPLRAEESALGATPAPGRPDDVPWLVGDPSRFIGLTDAPPQRIALSTTVADAIEMDRDRDDGPRAS